MKIIKVKFLGTEYSIKCDDNEVSKIKNLEARLNNRVKIHAKENINFSDTHKLLIVSLSLEDKINDLLLHQKKLIEMNDKIREKNKILSENKISDDLKTNLELISNKIKFIIEKIQSNKSE